MSYSNKFPTTLPIDITFFNAESVSPVKLNSIFSYLKVANYSIEMFLGNGIDYNVTENIRKKLIVNLSNVIGDVSGNVYMPYNYIETIYNIYKKYCSTYGGVGAEKYKTTQHAIFYREKDCIEVLDVINIPVNRSFANDVLVGIIFSISTTESRPFINTKCSVYTIGTNGSSDNESLTENIIINNASIPTDDLTDLIPLNPDILTNLNVTITADTYISHIELNNIFSASNLHLYIHSIYITEVKSQVAQGSHIATLKSSSSSSVSTPYNSFYALGKDHSSLYICRQPCKWSHIAYNTAVSPNNICAYATASGACIGNTYDIFVDTNTTIENKIGEPVCGGTIKNLNQSIHNTLVPYKSGNSGAYYKYEIDYNVSDPPMFIVMQSPLLTYYDKQHSLKYHPISMIRSDVGTTEIGEAYVYNFKAASGNPIIVDAKILTTARADIVKAVTTKISTMDNNKYIFISSDIGISQMINSMLNVTSMILGRSISVYAD
jgi:hypothetical protein